MASEETREGIRILLDEYEKLCKEMEDQSIVIIQQRQRISALETQNTQLITLMRKFVTHDDTFPPHHDWRGSCIYCGEGEHALDCPIKSARDLLAAMEE